MENIPPKLNAPLPYTISHSLGWKLQNGSLWNKSRAQTVLFASLSPSTLSILPSPNPQYLPLSLSLHPTLVHLFFLIRLAAGSNISEGASDENTGTPTALMTAKQEKNSILGQPKWTGIHAAGFPTRSLQESHAQMDSSSRSFVVAVVSQVLVI